MQRRSRVRLAHAAAEEVWAEEVGAEEVGAEEVGAGSGSSQGRVRAEVCVACAHCSILSIMGSIGAWACFCDPRIAALRRLACTG